MVKDEFEDDFFVEAKNEVEDISISDDVNESKASSEEQNNEFDKEDVSLQERPVISDSTPIIDRPLRKRKRSESTGDRNDFPPPQRIACMTQTTILLNRILHLLIANQKALFVRFFALIITCCRLYYIFISNNDFKSIFLESVFRFT